jgi:hypothetical protein
MTLDAAEFIRRFLLHVLPSGKTPDRVSCEACFAATSRSATGGGLISRSPADVAETDLGQLGHMAEHAGDAFLLYALDMAILEANRRARSLAENRASAADEAKSGNGELPKLVGKLEVVR